VLGDLRPDLTVILDVPVATGLDRRQEAAGRQRYERMSRAFHERVRAGFLALARAEPDRCVVVDATRPADVVADDVRELAARRFGVDLGGAARLP
jgi:dTMP kinase